MRPILLAFAAAMLANAADERSVREFLNRNHKAVRAVIKPADGCPISPLVSGAAIDGVLNTSDCSLRMFFPEARIGLRADAYEISVDDNRVLIVEMKGSGFEPDLYILDEQGYELSFDETSASDSIARAAVHVEAGTYYVVATSLSGLGSYTIQLSSQAPRMCVVAPITLGEDTTGAFDSSDCRLVDMAVGETNLTAVDGYLVQVSDKKVLKLSYSSPGASAFLALVSGDMDLVTASEEDGLAVESLASVSPGAYALFVVAMDDSGGPYTIGTSLQDIRPCAYGVLDAGATANGTLTADDCRDLDIFVPGDDPSLTDVWTFDVPERATVTVTMQSSEFDPYLSVTGASNRLLGVNGRTDASNATRVTLGLAPGRYSTMASTSGGSGAYTVQHQSSPPRNCEVLTLSPGTISGSITSNDCRVLDLVAPSSDSRLADAYRLVVPRKAVYTFAVVSDDFIPLLSIYGPGETLVYRHDPILGVETFRVMLAEGEYKVNIAAYFSTGAYRLTTTSAEPNACTSAGVVLTNGTYNGVLGTEDCAVSDVIPGVVSNSRIQYLTLVLADSAAVKFAVDSQAFPPTIVLLDEKLDFVDAAFNNRYTTHIELTSTLPAGTYNVAITSPLELEGPYILVTSSASEGPSQQVK
jgi:hypothetical protein